MALTNLQLKEWLATLADDSLVGVDEGGLILQEAGTDAYLEIGGMPEPYHVEAPPIPGSHAQDD